MPGTAAVVFVSDPEATEEPEEELLRAFYGLSRAESQLAALLLKGKRLPEIADELTITVNTAKTHAKRIYEKTGTRGQGEFILLVMRSPAVLDARSGIVLGAPQNTRPEKNRKSPNGVMTSKWGSLQNRLGRKGKDRKRRASERCGIDQAE